MSKATGKYCIRCFANIQQEDVVSFTDSGLCDACYQAAKKKTRASQERKQIQSQTVRPPKSDNEITGDIFIIGFGCLFFVGPADLIFDFGLEYEFFMFLRLAAFFGFAYMAYQNWDKPYKLADLPMSYIFSGLAVLYNPFISVSLTREIWTPVNIATGVLIFVFLNQKNKATNLNKLKPSTIPDPPIKHSNGSSIKENKQSNSTDVQPQTKLEKENVLGASKLIIDPLLIEKSLMDTSTGYLDTDEALGFVAGFSDAFLQSSAKHFGLEGTDEDLAMVTVLEVVFEGTNNSADRFYKLQTENNENFSAAQMQGGEQAFALLDKLKTASFSKDMQIGWLKEYNLWLKKKGGKTNRPSGEISALERIVGPAEMLIDFAKRIDHVGDEELAALMVWTTKERLKFFEMSPDAHFWFSEPGKDHMEDLLNYQSASYLKIRSLQSSGNTMEASFHMILLHLATGILESYSEPEIRAAAINMWITIRERSRNHIADAVERHLEEHEDKDAFLTELYGWEPKALLNPAKDE